MRNHLFFHLFLFIIFSVFISTAARAETEGKPSPCDAVTPAQAAEILGISPSDLKVETSGMMPDRCVMRSKIDFLKALSFSVYREKTAADASAALRRMGEGFSSLGKITPIPNLGDEAIYAGDDRLKRLVLRRGRFLVDIRSPRDRARQEKIARILLDHLN